MNLFPASRKPWVLLSVRVYRPMMSPRGLIPQVCVPVAPGKSIVLKLGVSIEELVAATRERLQANRQVVNRRLISSSIDEGAACGSKPTSARAIIRATLHG